MILQQYINDLYFLKSAFGESYNLPYALVNPHSYRGIYQDLAFEIAVNVNIVKALETAEYPIGRYFEGYKGGWYEMKYSTRIHVARWGNAHVFIPNDQIKKLYTLSEVNNVSNILALPISQHMPNTCYNVKESNNICPVCNGKIFYLDMNNLNLMKRCGSCNYTGLKQISIEDSEYVY